MLLNTIMSHELVGTENIYRYMTGGHAVVTLQSDSGVHHTYMFKAPNNRKKGEDTMFVSTLVGGNEWVYVGMYKNRDFRLTKASKFGRESAIVKGVAFIMRLMLKEGFHNEHMHLYHEGRADLLVGRLQSGRLHGSEREAPASVRAGRAVLEHDHRKLGQRAALPVRGRSGP